MSIDTNHWSGAVLRIISTQKSIEDINTMINIKPARVCIKGEPYSKRNQDSRKREENIWILESNLSEYEPLDLHISHLLSFLKGKSDVLKELQLDCYIDIVCSFSSENGQGSFTLDHDLLKELTENAIDLIVDLYPPTIK